MIVDISMIEAYNEWRAEKGVAAKDFSPQQFQIEYAKELALKRLVDVETLATDVINGDIDASADGLARRILAIVQGEDV